jgi:hypothetical protein
VVLGVVKRVVLALNRVNELQVSTGQIGIETDERDDLCVYIDESLRECEIDVDALTARNGMESGEIAGRWRTW